ncbi:MAG: aminoacyl-tRNA hydrolase [Defluviitaleaceae bacterium]|nr:aminoacyl-tRNA hydrolase [Defluviitaleaceae bacterium]
MRIIVGLGNPERGYKGTRHNIGAETVNKLAYDHNIDLNRAKFRAHFGEGFIAGKKVMLVKPQTYMNLSGESVRELLAYYKLGAEDILVLYDDTALDLGQVRVRERGTAGGHNGVKNIIYHLETTEFDRVRIGIDAKPPGWKLSDYVTSRFIQEEFDLMVDGITRAGDAVEMIVREGMTAAMNRFNPKG